LLLIFVALMLRNVTVTADSLKEIRAELSTLCRQYAELSAQGADEAQWQAFEDTVQERTAQLLEDLEKRPGYNPLRQVALHDLPRAIASRGKTPAMELEQRLGRHDPAVLSSAINRQIRQYGTPEGSHYGVDLLLVGMIVLDVALLVAIGYMLFWPVHKRFSWRPKDTESMLQQLEKRIERNPDAARFLGTRARLLADLERYDEALADIDRILDQHAHGVNVEKWQEFRETVAQKAAARQETQETEKHA
jgi:tetratricopeptide (TPR) repeat protein